MDLFNSEGTKYLKISLDNDIFNYHTKIIEFINNPKFFIDSDLLKILKLNYVKYGLICGSLVINNKILQNNNILYSNLQLKEEFKNIIILSPRELLEQVTFYINNIQILLKFLEEKHKEMMEYDNKIIIILSSLRNNNYMNYLNNLLDLNNIRLMINRIFFEYYQDLVINYNKLKQIKYDFFITETNIKLLLDNFEHIKLKIDEIINMDIFLLTENNNQHFNIKNKNGSIKYKEFINIIESRIENI